MLYVKTKVTDLGISPTFTFFLKISKNKPISSTTTIIKKNKIK